MAIIVEPRREDARVTGINAFVRRFDGTPTSARDARRFVVDTVENSAWVDVTAEAEICVAELAANAVLHTRSPYDVAIAGAPDSVRIDVVDMQPELLPIALPGTGAAGALLEDAITGRGLRLVSSLARRWGYTTTATTKSVWVELGEGAKVLDAVVVRGYEEEVAGDAFMVDLRGMPVLAAIGSGMQVEGLVRELQLGLFDASMGESERADLISLLDRSAPARLAGRYAAVQAAAAGEDRFDLKLAVSAELRDALGALSELLVTVPTGVPGSFAAPSEAVTDYRDWLRDEVVSQLRGGAPRDCPLGA